MDCLGDTMYSPGAFFEAPRQGCYGPERIGTGEWWIEYDNRVADATARPTLTGDPQ
ncbi:hypothetical protein HMPREF9622_00857 [Cutibacterium modestum HL037PA3]|nr:hypothetical protein HMPREF9621_00470 [Cutibacterium modestum HL037PA2]EFT15997.1 hypothetical protein HMPREF9622_00857 [Cutibacterium modestum HL037PA3]